MKLRASDGTLVDTIKVGRGPEALLFDGSSIWVANGGDNSVTKLRQSDGATCTFIVGTRPVALASDGKNVWVANNDSSSVTKLRADDGTNLGTFSAGKGPRGSCVRWHQRVGDEFLQQERDTIEYRWLVERQNRR